MLHVRLEVEIGAIGHSLELTPPEGVVIFDVAGRRAVVRELLFRMRTQTQIGFADPHLLDVPAKSFGAPVLVQLAVRPRFAEVLHLHQLELAQTKDEVARRDLVAKSLALLGDAEREPAPRRIDDVREVHEHPLCGLGAQPDLRRVLLHRADERLEHEVELPRRGEHTAALGAARRVGRLTARTTLILEVVLTPALRHGPVQSTSGSVKPATCPLATHTSGFMRIADSMPSTSSRRSTIDCHQRFRMFRRRRTPSGPKSYTALSPP